MTPAEAILTTVERLGLLYGLLVLGHLTWLWVAFKLGSASKW